MSQIIYPAPVSKVIYTEAKTLNPNTCTQSTSETSLGKITFIPKREGNVYYFLGAKITISAPNKLCFGITGTVAATWYLKVVDLYDNSILLNKSGLYNSGDITYTVTVNFDHYLTGVSPGIPIDLIDIRGWWDALDVQGLFLKQIVYRLITIYE